MELKGVNGQMELYNDKIIIKRKGLLSKMTQGFTKGDKSIYIRQISGIDFKPGGTFINGYLQFSMAGGNEGVGGAFQAGGDENTVMFTKKENDKAITIKEKIEELQGVTNSKVEAPSDANELRKFKELMDDGIISEEEFEAKKKQVLGM